MAVQRRRVPEDVAAVGEDDEIELGAYDRP
jgi:hypothetical protein